MNYIQRLDNIRVICRLLSILLLFGLFKIQHISRWMFSSTQRSARFREFVLYWIGWNPKEWYQRIMVGGWVCVCLCTYIYLHLRMSHCVCTEKRVCVCLKCACVCSRLLCLCAYTTCLCIYLLKCVRAFVYPVVWCECRTVCFLTALS